MTEFFNNTIYAHPHFNDNDLQVNDEKNTQIVKDSIDLTMTTYIRGELADISIRGDTKVIGANHMKSLISALIQFLLISNKFECQIQLNDIE